MNRMTVLSRAATWFLVLVSPGVLAQIYKVVDAEGNVVYTDQAPADGSAPMVLPELSIIKTDYPPETAAAGAEAAEQEAEAVEETTPRVLRKTYSDFRISQPQQEQTFWGTENAVVIGWSSSVPLLPELSVRLYVDGKPVATTADNLYAMTLDRGEHSTYAELLDPRGRRIITTPAVIFFVKQHSIGVNQPQATPRNGT
ncbi:MAG TPA: DUF4124 domain-containing protein [Xanthomonadales bacterium]|nr:DUF4124 domain-containing protein [Xanthomonadales bacterium]